jgi:hypothetical protein
MKDVVFINDPDGYWIEIVQPTLLTQLGRLALLTARAGTGSVNSILLFSSGKTNDSLFHS